MKKFTNLLLVGVIIAFTLTACDDSLSGNENENPIPPALSQVVDIEFTIPDSTNLINYASQQIDYNGEMVTGYSLDQFVNMDSVNAYLDEDDFDGRELFAIEIVSNDEDGNWSPRTNGYYDLAWEDFITGYLLPDEKGRTFFPNENIATGYNVKWAHYIKLYRRIDVALDADTIIFETGALDLVDIYHQAGNGNFYTDPGIPLSSFISAYITANPDDFDYQFTSVYDGTELYSWNDVQSAYWLTTQNKAVFLNDDGTEFLSSFKKLIKIELVEIQK